MHRQTSINPLSLRLLLLQTAACNQPIYDWTNAECVFTKALIEKHCTWGGCAHLRKLSVDFTS